MPRSSTAVAFGKMFERQIFHHGAEIAWKCSTSFLLENALAPLHWAAFIAELAWKAIIHPVCVDGGNTDPVLSCYAIPGRGPLVKAQKLNSSTWLGPTRSPVALFPSPFLHTALNPDFLPGRPHPQPSRWFFNADSALITAVIKYVILC